MADRRGLLSPRRKPNVGSNPTAFTNLENGARSVQAAYRDARSFSEHTGVTDA